MRIFKTEEWVNVMRKFTYKGFDITIFRTYDGDKIFISKDGVQVYAHRVHKGKAIERVRFLLG